MTPRDVPVDRDRTRRGVTDAGAVAAGVAAFVGARTGIPPGWIPAVLGGAVLVTVAASVARRPVILIPAVLLAASGLAAHAQAGLGGLPERFVGTVQVIDVSTDTYLGVTARVRAGSHQLRLVPPETGRELVAGSGPGDRLEVSGPVRPDDPARARARGSHVAGRLHATRVRPGPAPGPLWRVVAHVRGGVRSLAGGLPASQRGMFEGFVLGDASAQSELQLADFRNSGLTHLFVTSGEHVAFMLLLFAPLLRRVGLRTRWVLTVGICVFYAVVTGLQPSVLRAATMAVLATTASGLGRPVRSWRTLGFAVVALVLADPFLVGSVAFGLSVGACAGIVGLARPLVRVFAGPLWFRRAFAVTIAAQIGAAPLLVGFPGGMPLAAILANVLAVPVASGVMVLGLPALVVAATGVPGAAIVAWIPRLLLAWIEGVARVTTSLPLGHLGGVAVTVAVVGLGVVLVARRVGLRRLGVAGGTVAVVAVLSPLFIAPRDPPDADGAVLVRRRDTTLVVVTGSTRTDALLTGLSSERVGAVDGVVVPHGDAADVEALAAIGHRHRIGHVITPERIVGLGQPQTVVAVGDRVHIGRAVIRVVATAPLLSVYVEPP